MNSCPYLVYKACELSRMETDSSQKQNHPKTHVYAFIEGRIARYDGPRLLRSSAGMNFL